MKEIEVKARVRDKSRLIKELEKLKIVLGEPIIQKDIIFAENLPDFTDFQPNINFLRIRQENDKSIFTLKRSELNETENTEHETEVANRGELTEIIKLLGFQEAVRVNKTRRKARYQDFEVCVDEIDGLGSFIELEKLVERGDIEAIQTELFGFLKKLGISEDDRVTLGYDTLMAMANKQ